MPDSDIHRLVERIEGASGPDRELDRDIMIAAVPCDRAPFRYWAPVNESTGFGGVDVERVYYAPHCAQAVAVPHFTGSIDAAMTLVPEGWAFSLAEMMGLPLERRWRCHLRDHNEPYNPATCAWVDKDCPTAPLSIVCAALRARITKRTDDE